MADSDLDFQLWLKSRWDGDAMKAAQADFKKTEKAAKDTDESMSKMGSGAAAGLKAALGELLAIATILNELKEGFTEVTAQEQAFNRLADAASRFGGNAGELNTQFEKLAKTIQEKSGLDDDALYLAMVKVYQATGDMNEAMGQAALAADVARGRNISLEESLTLVNNVASGQTRELLKLQLGFVATGDRAKDSAAGLEILRQKFGGSAAAAKGTTVELDKLKEEWGNVRNDFISGSSEMLGGVLKFVNLGLQPFFISLQLAGNSIKTIIATVREFGGVIGSIIAGDWKGAKEGLAKTKDTLVDGFENAFEIIKARAEKMWATINGTAGGAIEAPKAKGTGTGGGGGAGGSADDKHNPMLGPSLKEFEDYKEKVFEFEQKLIKERAAMWAKANAARKKLEDASADEDKKRMREIDDERERLMDEQTRRILDDVRLKKQMAEYEKQMTLDTMSMVSGALSSMFGESKEVAIAEAIINTYVGASKALAQTGIWGVIQAAIIIAAGMAQVAKIQSTEPSTKGSGFDDPGNDAAARIGGRRWAADMIGEFTRGVSAGWRDGMGGGGSSTSNTYDNRRTYNVHMHGAGLMDPTNVQMMKQFKRTLDVIDTQIEGQRTIARSR